MLKIFIEFDADVDLYVLMCDDRRMRPMPAGKRLFRAPPHPDINFSHETMQAAEDAASKLRSYLGALEPKKISKKDQREFIA